MRFLTTIASCVVLIGCTPSSVPTNTGIYMLLDTSGTYREELQKAQQIIRYTLSRLDAKDSFAVARIDTASFSEKDIVAKASMIVRARSIGRNACSRKISVNSSRRSNPPLIRISPADYCRRSSS